MSVACIAEPAGESLYRKLGDVQGWPETSFMVRVEDIIEGHPGVERLENTLGHRPGLAPRFAEVHDRENETVTGTAVRPTFLRTKMPEDGDQDWL